MALIRFGIMFISMCQTFYKLSLMALTKGTLLDTNITSGIMRILIKRNSGWEKKILAIMCEYFQ